VNTTRALGALLSVALLLPAIAAPAAFATPNDPVVRHAVEDGVVVLDLIVDDTTTSPAAGPAVRLTPGQANVPSTLPRNDSAQSATNYGTLSAALIDLYAKGAGQSVEQFLSAQAPTLPSTFASVDKPMDMRDLDRQLRGQGLSFDGKKVSDLSGWMRSLSAKPSPDSAVAIQASRWASEAMKLQMPAVSAPKMTTPGMPNDALMFGLFANRSLTAMATDHPDLFGEVSRSGLTSEAGKTAWRSSMLQAWDSIDRGLESNLLDRCSAGFMAGMASGSSKTASRIGGDCGTCVASGLASHSYMNRLWDAAGNGNTTLFDHNDSTVNISEWGSMQNWMVDALAQGNAKMLPGTGTGGSTKPATTGCSSPAAADTLSSTLPGVFGQLLNRP
jgi:hypothetical protein